MKWFPIQFLSVNSPPVVNSPGGYLLRELKSLGDGYWERLK